MKVYTIAHMKTLYELFTWFSVNVLTVVHIRDNDKKYKQRHVSKHNSGAVT